jgi:type II secretory pathway pseudopilin PulG
MDPRSSSEAGFTLIEALVAIVILVFGLMAVSNLFIVATSSTSVANQGTGAAVAASEQLEVIRGTPWPALAAVAPGGDLINDTPAVASPPCGNPDPAVLLATFHCDADLPGVGRVHVRWQITNTPGGPPPVPVWTRTLFVQVQAEGTGALSGARSRALFSMFRTCTGTSVADGGVCPDPPLGGGF